MSKQSSGGEDNNSSIRFTPLSGVDSESPLCYLLDIDGFLILLDCGIDELLNVDYLARLAPYAGQIQAVLVSHADLPHLGGLPYAVAKLGLNCPVFSTIPTYKMGQMFCYDAFQSRTNAVNFTSFSLDDVDAAFELFHQLKYSQHYTLSDSRVQITPYPAGRTLGGSIWRIVKDTQEIVYAVDFNHKSERHLASAAIDHFHRPSLLITDAYNALAAQSSRRTRESELAEEIIKALKGDGNVLLPVDTAGRVLELLLFLDGLWSEREFLRAYSLVFMTNISVNTLEFARSMLEWMSDAMMDTFHAKKDNPFSFEHVRLCHDREELDDVSRPMVVLASLGSLDSGFARDLFFEWSVDPKNRIIFSSRASSATLARKVMTTSIPCKLSLLHESRVPLVGAELEDWKAQKRAEIAAEKAAELAELAGLSASAESADGSGLIDDEAGPKAQAGGLVRDAIGADGDALVDDEDEDDFAGYSMDTRTFFEEGVHDLLITPDIENQATFPCPPSPPPFDEYGELVNPEELKPADAFLGPLVQDDAQAPLSDDGELKQEPAALSAEPEADEFGGEKPMKYIVQEKSVDVMSRIRYIEFEGRSDARSLKNIIHSILPKKLILVHGSAEGIDALSQYVKDHVPSCDGVVSTAISTSSFINFQTSTFSVLVDDSTFSSLKFHKIGEYELSYLSAGLFAAPTSPDLIDDVSSPSSSSSTSTSTSSSSSSSSSSSHSSSSSNTTTLSIPNSQQVKSLRPLPQSNIKPHKPAFIGNVKLSDFKLILTKAGFNAEFMGSGSDKALVVNNCLILRRPPTSPQITMEGILSDEYYRVRELLYAQYTIV